MAGERKTLRRFFRQVPTISPRVFETSFYEAMISAAEPLPTEEILFVEDPSPVRKGALALISNKEITKQNFNIKSCQVSNSPCNLTFEAAPISNNQYMFPKGTVQGTDEKFKRRLGNVT